MLIMNQRCARRLGDSRVSVHLADDLYRAGLDVDGHLVQ